jgi:hypothetical protein
MKNAFPTGTPMHLNPNTPSVMLYNTSIQEGEKCPVGIFRIEYVTNIDGILPRREEGRLIWDLKDHTGIYNSVDIDNALELGYKVKLIEGYYWMKTENVFDNYIFKKNAKKGSAQYTLAKLMMNGLYGKTIQRPILDENVIIRLNEEFIKLHIKFGGVTMRALMAVFISPIKMKINWPLKSRSLAIWEVLFWDTVARLCWTTFKSPTHSLTQQILNNKLNILPIILIRIVFRFTNEI